MSKVKDNKNTSNTATVSKERKMAPVSIADKNTAAHSHLKGSKVKDCN